MPLWWQSFIYIGIRSVLPGIIAEAPAVMIYQLCWYLQYTIADIAATADGADTSAEVRVKIGYRMKIAALAGAAGFP